MSEKTKENICFFCKKYQYQVKNLISNGHESFLCNECVDFCNNLLLKKKNSFNTLYQDDFISLYTPEKIKKYLDDYIIGQDYAKKVLSVSIYNHYKRIKCLQKNIHNEFVLERSNILLTGPTGSGKTFMIKTLSKLIKVPFVISDATTLTESGYVGDDVENILLQLLYKANFDVKLSEIGVIYIDEIDKISRKSENTSITRDVSGEGVQQSLLKMIEGSIIKVPLKGGRKHFNQEFVNIDTSNILFICGGSFEGIDKIIAKRMNVNRFNIGFQSTLRVIHDNNNTNYNHIMSKIATNDFIKFGIIPELIGRLSIHVVFHELSLIDLENILNFSKNSFINQYKFLLSLDNIEIFFTKDAIKEISKMAFKLNLGARGLKYIVEKILMEIMYIIPSKKNIVLITINRSTVLHKDSPLVTLKDNTIIKLKDLN